jgi:hypothetical protein
MLPAGWLVVAVVLAILLTGWVTLTLTRLDRLHARVDAAQAALDAQLVRRSGALLTLVESPSVGLPPDRRAELAGFARAAMLAVPDERPTAENRVGRAIAELSEHHDSLPPAAADELHEAATRVLIARRFFNDAVRDTRTLRSRRMPRLLRLAGRRDLPQYFDIADTTPLRTSPEPEPEEPEPEASEGTNA